MLPYLQIHKFNKSLQLKFNLTFYNSLLTLSKVYGHNWSDLNLDFFTN